ncbi:MAG: hypothetical protein C7K11_03180 [Candidatus Amulumruptor caecigallinarius]|uniref:Uncharacterized protein n=1 Tax=Candidatus Amulumruptor caecigallinarius TaxID=2109911 RepID=A0A4Q0U9W4_9BACT|nr:MAG: hypothetical protein C7K11_03180 [Candidatus Amulumruptor caecigallinarius]HJE39848.1 hypothetical protein [Candidatus Amulumruptor caecigallinarius]
MNQRADYIIPECYVDTNLVETLVCTAGCNHQKGCNQVAKVMQEKFSDRFAVGIIDADKRKPGYLNEFTEIASSEHLKLLRHNHRPHFIILVHPAIDGFILSCAEVGEVNMVDYELSPVLKDFTAQTKRVMSNKDTRFKNLFRAMQHVREIKLMKSLISYLISRTYKASNSELVGIFAAQ